MNPTSLVLCFLTLFAPKWWGFENNDEIRLFVAQGFTSQSMISSMPLLSKLSETTSPRRRPYGYYATTKREQKLLNDKSINGEVGSKENVTDDDDDDDDDISTTDGNLTTTTTESTLSSYLMATDFNTSMAEIFDEISQRISDGSTEILQNITTVLDEQLTQLPDSKAQELTEYIGGLANSIQKAQQEEVQRQMEELEKLFVNPLERVAFSDAPLFELNDKKQQQAKFGIEPVQIENELVLAGANSTIQKSARMRTSKLFQNLNIAPLYYSVALLYRWASKSKETLAYPSIYLLSAYKELANVIKTRGGPRRRRRKKEGETTYEDNLKDAEAFQSGWKRTGEIAAKGPYAKKWAILRRSAEVWAYFSSFYLKDRRICKKYNSGQWTEEKFVAERSKLGAEVTQNLLRLGPTFIKVRDHNFIYI
jgi:hypothetical protein